MDHQQILRIRILSRFSEVEATCDDRFAVDNHYLVVGNAVFRIDQRFDASMAQEIGFGVALPADALVENGFNNHPTLLGRYQCFRDGF